MKSSLGFGLTRPDLAILPSEETFSIQILSA
jgi:hypothetical protein